MTHQPRRKEEIYNDLRDGIRGQIPGMTQFEDGSFNDRWLDAYAEEIQLLEAKILAAQFSLWVDYAGDGELTRTDLESAGVVFTGWSTDEIDTLLSNVNNFSKDVHLDQIGELVGVERDPGTKASGTVTITTQSSTTQVNEGLEVATEPDSNGDYLSYTVDSDASPDPGNTTVDVSVTAEVVGNEYNVGAGTVTFLPDPDPGIEAVTNNAEITGGQDRESNSDYRESLKGAVISQSGGGTAGGVEGGVEGVSGVSDAELDEFVDDTPPHVDVIVDGGSDSDITDKIADVKPVGIRHDLVRPESINVGYDTELVGSDIDTSFVSDEIDDYIQDLGLGESLRRVKIVQRVMNADGDIAYIGSLTIPATTVVNESHIFQSGTDLYGLNFSPALHVAGEEHLFVSGTDIYETTYENVLDDSNVDVTATVSGVETTLTKGTDYQVIDNSGNGKNDSIDFSIGGSNPDDHSTFEVEYDVHNDEFATPTVTGTLSGTEDHTFAAQTDYDIIDSSGTSVLSSPGSAGNPDRIDWSLAGDDPDADTRFFIDYDVQRVILNDEATTVREKISLDGARTDISVIAPA